MRKGDEPIGFMVVLPDFNQVLRRMKGKILSFRLGKIFLFQAQNHRCARDRADADSYQNMGVNYAMYIEAYKDWTRTDHTFIEASCIDEENIPSRLGVERIGGKHYRTYRTYRYELKQEKI